MIGTTVGPYRVLEKLGEGGMGEVYRARDTRLDRDVAIKILPPAFAADAERLARFEREAKTLASLNHTHIAHIHGIEDTPTGRALVMELVEGEDLSVRISRGALPIAETVAIARQIADALEAAHERGIIHRDLKPANIKVRDDGTVKVLDFGLAKALDPSAGSNPDLMNSPTITSPATQLGTILGTAAYMAPEQAKGRAVDKRADVWAFGVVLYEMLTGQRAFEGEDISTTLAAVLMRDPDWTALPAGTPPALAQLLRRCLERDPKLRLRDIGEARVLLSSPEALRASGAPAAPPAAWAGVRIAWLVAAVALVIAVAAGWPVLTGARGAASTARIEASLAAPPGFVFGEGLALSPDGRRIVLSAVDQETSVASLWLRELDSVAPVKLAQTDGGFMPFWSPDGAHIAFFADGKLKKTDLQGSPPQVICDAPSARGGAWGPDGRIVFAGTFRTGLEMVDAAGGKPEPLTTLDEGRHEKSHRWPQFLPGGEHVLFVAQTGEAGAKDDASTIEALSLKDRRRTRLLAANSSPLYAAPGFLLFWRDGALRGQAFDAGRLALSGAVFPVATGVAYDGNEFAYATVAADGTLVYLAGAVRGESSLSVVDRAGRSLRTIADPVFIEGGLALSPDGSRLAVAVTAPGARDTDIWTYDLARGTSGPLTFGEGGDRNPVWSHDGAHILYTNDSQNDGTIYRRAADGRGQAELMATTPAGLLAYGWSRDGRWLLAGASADQTSRDVVRYDRDARKITPLVETRANDYSAVLSPDERWIAYASEQTGRTEIYVRAMGDEDGVWQISTQGGRTPLWRRDGRELYFVTPQNRLMVVNVDGRRAFVYSTPRELFGALFNSSGYEDRFYAPMPDGQSFVIDVLKERTASLLTLVTNWTAKAGR
ncbi:MAG TPA: protein kinase [Vicinamibacterales bacterium]|nr:protein kinase [Vicinamibacterales bacterium]